MAEDFAVTCSLVPRDCLLSGSYPSGRDFAPRFFRPRLAMPPLRFANPSPPSGWIEDFHLQAVVRARHTNKSPDPRPGRGKAHLREPVTSP